jgi:hypothetical protein
MSFKIKLLKAFVIPMIYIVVGIAIPFAAIRFYIKGVVDEFSELNRCAVDAWRS